MDKGTFVASKLPLFLYPQLLPANSRLQTTILVYFGYRKAAFVEKSFPHGW